MSIIGLGLGTTACKAIAINEEGKIISVASIEYKPVKSKMPRIFGQTKKFLCYEEIV